MLQKINVYYLGKVYFMFHCKVVYKYHYKKERLRGKSYVNPAKNTSKERNWTRKAIRPDSRKRYSTRLPA